MPTYEYECKLCGRVFEEFHSITAKPLTVIPCECDKCNNRAPVVRRIGTGSGLIFKGSGFYLTDYRSDSYKKAAKAEREAASSSSSSGDAGTGKPSGKPKGKARTSASRHGKKAS